MELFEQPIIAGVPNYAILQCVQPLDFATNFRKIAAVATTLNHSLYDGINWNFFLGYDQPPEPPFQRLKNFTWSNVGDDLDATLRFTADECEQLKSLLFLPEWLRNENGEVVSSRYALAIYLSYLSYPQKLRYLSKFGRSKSTASRTMKTMLQTLDPLASKCLSMSRRLWRDRLPVYAEAVRAKTRNATDKVVAFADGTFKHSLVPGELQQDIYSGYEKCHGFKWLGAAFPDGMWGFFAGPYVGKFGDGKLVRLSGFEQEFKTIAYRNGRWGYRCYGDWAFAFSAWMLTQETKQLFKTATFYKKVRLYNSLSPLYLRHAAFLTNCRACFREGNQVSSYFDMCPPSIFEFLNAD